jgi:hypothetical protein
MRRAYGTQLIFLTNFRRIEIRRYNISRPEGTFRFLIAQVESIRRYKTAFNAKAKCAICSTVCFAVTIMRKHSSPLGTVGKLMG